MQSARAADSRGRVERPDTRQYLSFILAGEEYGVDILRVQEVKGWTPVTRMPQLPEFVPGVLNLRGSIVPVVDLRARFGLEQIEYSPTTVIVVITVGQGEVRQAVGIVVDGVSDVVDVEDASVRPAPRFGTALDAAYIRGIAELGDKMVMLLDADRLLGADELEGLRVGA